MVSGEHTGLRWPFRPCKISLHSLQETTKSLWWSPADLAHVLSAVDYAWPSKYAKLRK